MFAKFLARALVAGFAVFAFAGAASAEEDSILILDASGSMWGQINKEAKIAIAKRVMGDVIAKTPADRRLGLIAYGHRREGDCADIEEVAPLGTDRAAIKATVEKLNAKGKTPMTNSVKLAAEKLQYTKNKATIVLVSDGIETCAPDPCAAAAALEAAGADLTVHVVGFDVSEENAQAQLRCIAENTGGKFISASNATELGTALQSTVAAATPSAPAANLYLRATELQGGPVIDKGLAWSVKPSAGGAAVVNQPNAGEVSATVQPGTYDVEVVRASDGLKGSAKGVVIANNAQKTVTVALEFPVNATVAPEPANAGVAGSDIKVKWTGPNRRGDFIAIAKKDASPGETDAYEYVSIANPANIRLPVAPGTYEIRYVLGSPYRTLAKIDYQVTPASATLSAADTAVAGGEVEIAFTGPGGSNDYVTVTKPDRPDNEYGDYAYAKAGSPAKIKMPLEAGAYELRFVQTGSKVLARRPIAVSAAEASISGPATAIAGESVKIAFTGPGGSNDYVTVTKPNASDNEYLDYAYAKQGSPQEIRMPLDAGPYELRFVQGGGKVIARQTINVAAASATLSAPASAKAGATVAVAFTGPPAGSGDYITVTEVGAPDSKYMDYAYSNVGSPAQIKMPTTPGDYELRFIHGNKNVLARRPIKVTP
jgi:Ca-activated chloride channel family protein